MIFLLFFMTNFIACREPLGEPDYESFEGEAIVALEDISNTGPDPFRTGEQRLNIGLFYEGESTDAVVIDDVDTAFYIWSETFSIVSSNDPVEGDWSDEIIVGDFGWWGGGIFSNQTLDFSNWTTMCLSLKSSSSTLANVEVGIGQGDGEVLGWASVDEYGFQNDGYWYHIRIPMNALTLSLDATQINMPFNIRGEGIAGDALKIDDLYLTTDPVDEVLEEEE